MPPATEVSVQPQSFIDNNSGRQSDLAKTARYYFDTISPDPQRPRANNISESYQQPTEPTGVNAEKVVTSTRKDVLQGETFEPIFFPLRVIAALKVLGFVVGHTNRLSDIDDRGLTLWMGVLFGLSLLDHALAYHPNRLHSGATVWETTGRYFFYYFLFFFIQHSAVAAVPVAFLSLCKAGCFIYEVIYPSSYNTLRSVQYDLMVLMEVLLLLVSLLVVLKEGFSCVIPIMCCLWFRYRDWYCVDGQASERARVTY